MTEVEFISHSVEPAEAEVFTGAGSIRVACRTRVDAIFARHLPEIGPNIIEVVASLDGHARPSELADNNH